MAGDNESDCIEVISAVPRQHGREDALSTAAYGPANGHTTHSTNKETGFPGAPSAENRNPSDEQQTANLIASGASPRLIMQASDVFESSETYSLPRMPLRSFGLSDQNSPPGMRLSFENVVTVDQIRNMFFPADQRNIVEIQEPRRGQGVVNVQFKSLATAQAALNHRMEGVIRQDTRDHAALRKNDKIAEELGAKLKQVNRLIAVLEKNVAASSKITKSASTAASPSTTASPAAAAPKYVPKSQQSLTKAEHEKLVSAAVKATEEKLKKKHESDLKRLNTIRDKEKTKAIRDYERKRRRSPSPDPAIRVRLPSLSQTPAAHLATPFSSPPPPKTPRLTIALSDGEDDDNLEEIAPKTPARTPRTPATPRRKPARITTSALQTPQGPSAATCTQFGLLTPQTTHNRTFEDDVSTNSSLSTLSSTTSLSPSLSTPLTPASPSPIALNQYRYQAAAPSPSPAPIPNRIGAFGFRHPVTLNDSPLGRRFVRNIGRPNTGPASNANAHKRNGTMESPIQLGDSDDDDDETEGMIRVGGRTQPASEPAA